MNIFVQHTGRIGICLYMDFVYNFLTTSFTYMRISLYITQYREEHIRGQIKYLYGAWFINMCCIMYEVMMKLSIRDG